MNNAALFNIKVTRGSKVKIGQITLGGNEQLSSFKIRKAMKDTKQKAFWRIFKRSKFTSSSYEKDKLAILSKYYSIGYRDAQIEKDSVYLLDQKHLAIDLKFSEGNLYHFGNIEWIGNTKFTTGMLDTVLGIKYGDIYNKSTLETRLNMSQDGRDIS